MTDLIKDSYVFWGGVKLQAQYEQTAPSPATGENVIFLVRKTERCQVNFGGIGMQANAGQAATTFFTGDSLSWTTSPTQTCKLAAMYNLRPGIDDVYKGMVIGGVLPPSYQSGHMDTGCSAKVTNTGISGIKSKGGQPVAIYVELT